ncbi:MAG: PLP-dependent aminotransferase family protein [Anaerolineae bacterium]
MLTQQIPTPTLQLADWAKTMSRSVLRQMIAVVSRPGILSFAGGLPDPALFPAAELSQAMAHVLANDPLALQYRPPFPPLKRHIVKLMAQRSVACTEEQVFITTGAQQGLDVLARLLLNPGSEVMLEEIVYTGAQQAVSPHQPYILTVPTDLETGIDVDVLETHLAGGARPAFLYVIPTAHNPLGVSISPEKRGRLAALARQYGVPIVEDDPYGFLTYGDWGSGNGENQLPLRALDDEWVFYLGSFSKILAPGLRLGWMIAPEHLIPKLTVVKEMGDLESSALMQRAVAAYLDAGHLPDHLATLREVYGRRRDAMLSALSRHFPATACWTHPDAGMFIWVELPEHIDTAVLLETAVAQEKVAFIPGHAFALHGTPAQNCLRLNFSNATPEQIEDGIARLGKLIN